MSRVSLVISAAARFGAFVAVATALAGCVSVTNEPVNTVALTEADIGPAVPESPNPEDTTIIGLAFSGGGSRAAAFSYGLLNELEATPLPGDGRGRSMLESVRFISGVSGGSVTAAYYGLRGKAGYRDFRDKFLLQDAEADMRTAVRPTNILRAITGGVNDQSAFGGWLDRNLLKGARFADLNGPGRPVIWINASDLYNRTPFIFNKETFAALCSDLSKMPVAEAVAASAAVPVVFAPIVIEAYGPQCQYNPPGWLEAVKGNPNASSAVKAYARALETYRDPAKLKYVKLVDGGITDNFGVTGMALAREAAQTPYGPLSPREAVRLKRVIYLVADAGRAPDADWGATVKGPGMMELVNAVTDAAISNSVRDGYDSFRATLERWRNDLIQYRCGLDQAEVKRLLNSTANWNCRDLEFFVTTVSVDGLDPITRKQFQEIETRLKLPKGQVDLAISAGRDALRRDPVWQQALKSMLAPATSPVAAEPVPAPQTN